MARVICTLTNASELINGVKFASHKLGMISEEISEEIADLFAAVTGFKAADKKGQVIEDAATGDTAGNGAAGNGAAGSDAKPAA